MGKLGININDEPENFKLPETPPKAPPPAMCKGDMQLGSGCGKCERCREQMRQLMPSERAAYISEISRLKAERDSAYGAALRHVNRIVLMMEDLPVELKSKILEEVWKK